MSRPAFRSHNSFGRISILIALSTCFGAAAGQSAPTATPRVAAFYNVENLFDTANDPGADDGDFTPRGAYRWTEADLRAKIGRVATVLAEIGADVVGLAEIENRRVLDSLAAHPALAVFDYRIVHIDSPDPRGIDVALLYRPSRFAPTAIAVHPYRLLPRYPTRHMLEVEGIWAGHPARWLVCHLPSAVSAHQVRRLAAESLGQLADSLLRAAPERTLLVAGDLNANPGSPLLRAVTAPGGLRNPFETLFAAGYGTYLYRGRWNLYDQILLGGTPPGTPPGTPRARIFIRDELIQPDGPYRGYPYRTFSGTRNIGGYSDHLPVVLVFEDDHSL